ncbi:MAG: type III pantothenate kinase, partial [Acidobacteriota bacterium]|nr:type III pantothenate kinase [Acidobacteriota bacterium]
CRDYLRVGPLVVDAGIRTGIPLRYEDPKQVGADRVVNAVAVRRLYKGPACVVDFGTATTFDALSAAGEYLGGAIAPGVGIAADALFRRAAKLPRVELRHPPSAIGRNTVHSLQSGLLYGYVGLVEGMVERFRAELGPEMKTVATGMLAEQIARETRAIDIVEPWLALQGLKIIFELNRNIPNVPR